MKRQAVIDLCERYLAPATVEVVCREPYAPYMPQNWNGILVLGEAQNLSNRYKGYVERIDRMTASEKFFRLASQAPSCDLGVMPWDNGSLKLAVEAAFHEAAAATAVSNAIPWSQTAKYGLKNKTPAPELEGCAAQFWAEMLQLLHPRHIVASGSRAHRVLAEVKWPGKVTKLLHPSAMRFIKATLPEKELLAKYPEVEAVIKNCPPEWVRKYRRMKIRFACHAVDKAREEQNQIA